MRTENGKRRTENNTWTIIKKEFARFFGDRQLLFTAVIMPGLLLYLIYTFMGSGMSRMATEGKDDLVVVRVENMPESVAPLIEGVSAVAVVPQLVSQEDVENLESKDLNEVLMRFPEGFDTLVASYDPQSGESIPTRPTTPLPASITCCRVRSRLMRTD